MPQFTYAGPHLKVDTVFPDGSTLEGTENGVPVDVSDAQAEFLAGNPEWVPASAPSKGKKAAPAAATDNPAPAEED